MITVKASGSFKNTEKFINHASSANIRRILESYGRAGVDALARATPIDTGKTSESWDFEIVQGKGMIKVVWTNSNMAGDTNIPIAILLEYGHATRNGGYVTGIDYINPALSKIFDKMANDAWKEVTKG